MIGCNDGWIGLQTTSTFLDARNTKQLVKSQEWMEMKQKTQTMRQIGYQSMFIDSGKTDEFRVLAFRTTIDKYQLIAFDAGETGMITDGIYDTGVVAL